MGPPKRNCPDVISLLPFMSMLRGPFPKAWAHVPLPCRRNKLRAPRHFPGTQSVPEAPRSNLAPERTWKAGRATVSLMPFLPLPVSGRPLNRGPSAPPPVRVRPHHSPDAGSALGIKNTGCPVVGLSAEAPRAPAAMDPSPSRAGG